MSPQLSSKRLFPTQEASSAPTQCSPGPRIPQCTVQGGTATTLSVCLPAARMVPEGRATPQSLGLSRVQLVDRCFVSVWGAQGSQGLDGGHRGQRRSLLGGLLCAVLKERRRRIQILVAAFPFVSRGSWAESSLPCLETNLSASLGWVALGKSLNLFLWIL